jgi:hypothetical protein
MKKTNFTFPANRSSLIIAILMAIFSLADTVSAQNSPCSMACTGTVNVTLDNIDCSATITPDMLLNGEATSCSNGSFIVRLSVLGQYLNPENVVTSNEIGKNVKAEVIDQNSGNKCWSTLVIEDKLAPVIYCPEPGSIQSIYCYEEPLFAPSAVDNCDGPVSVNVLSHHEVSNVSCNVSYLSSNVLRRVTRTYNAKDKSGNTSAPCTVVYDVLVLEDLSQIVMPRNYLSQNDQHLECDGNWAKLPNGHPSPTNIGLQPGTGVPYLASWIPFRSGAAEINATGMPYSVSLTGGATGNGGGRVLGAQVCFTAPMTSNLSFNWSTGMINNNGETTGGSFNNDEPAYSINGVETFIATGDHLGTVSGVFNQVLNSGDEFCFRVYTQNIGFYTVLNITNLVAPIVHTPIYPNNDQTCNLIVSYTDVKLPPIQCVEKIMRTWSVIEWSCLSPQRTRTYVQMIEIKDSQAPVIQPIDPIYATTSGHTCTAGIILPAVMVSDNCTPSNLIRVTITGGSSFIEGNGGFTHLPAGKHTVVYTAYDGCGNYTQLEVPVVVEDYTPPVAVCIQHTTVAVTDDGTAWVPATVFDNGSYDECFLSKVLVRKMNEEDLCEPCLTPSFAGFHYLGERAGKYYYLSQHRAKPHRAYKTAKAMGGFPVTITSADENTWLNDLVSPKVQQESYLIGLNYDDKHHVWSWNSGSSATYRNWASGQPYYYGGDYALVVPADARWYRSEDDHEEYFYVVEITDPCGLGDYVKFCCDDIGDNVTVVMRAIDKSGNWNECMVHVEVQDKLPPRITCPPHVTHECQIHFDPENLGASFGHATATDNCMSSLEESAVFDINQCNIGTIIRTFIATDAGGRTAQCTQKIEIYNPHPFNYNDVIWPLDVEMEGCDDPNSSEYHPSVVGGFPTLIQDKCDLAGVTWTDHVFRFNNAEGEACFKIIRKWKVIDWCQFHNGEYFVTYHDQIIKVHNKVKPTITSSCEPVSTCTFDPNCQAGFIELVATAEDDCTTELRWEARIFPFNSSSFDTGLSRTGTGNVANASGNYPIGTHRVEWIFSDGCGNVQKCSQEFSVVNCKAPTPYLIQGLASTLMGVDTNGDGQTDNGMLEIWASDFNLASEHPCGYDVIFSFSSDINDNVRFYDCDDIGRQYVTIYVSVITPMGDIISAFAETFIDVQDNSGVCPDSNGGRAAVSGRLATEMEETVRDAEVLLHGAEALKQMTDDSGLYSFDNITMGSSFDISVMKDDDHSNGVSTLDMVLIQRHILGIESLDSPYKIIAADVFKDGNIATSDLVELRRLVLGTTESFQNNTSWRFIDKSYEFDDATAPLYEPFTENYEVFGITNNMNIDFVAVKVGDVNNSVSANLMSNNMEPRTAQALNLIFENTQFEAGEEFEVNFTMDTDVNVFGAQFTMSFDKTALEFAGVNSANLNISDDNFGFRNINNGLITFSWNENFAVEAQEMMTLKFVAKTAGDLSNAIAINSKITKAEAYTEDLKVMPVVLRTVENANMFALHQNTPNPFNATTMISFDLPEAAQTRLTLFDVTGKVIRVFSNYYEAGSHTFRINRNDISATGVLYYQLEAGAHSAIRKMVIIE